MTFLRFKSVSEMTGRGRTGLYLDIRRGLMVEPVKVSAKAVAWPYEDIKALTTARAGGATEDQLRALVVRLHERRKHAAADVLAGA